MEPEQEYRKQLTRRHFLGRSGAAVIGTVALAALLNEDLFAQTRPGSADPFAPKRPHFPSTAKRVIFLNMTGAPSQVDLFDYKPELVKLDGQNIPDSAVQGLRLGPFTNKDAMKVFASPWKFQPCGSSGLMLSELLPCLSEIVDEIAFIRSMHTNEINHVPAQLLLSTGSPRMGRPTMGSWVLYGLGSENRNLPGFIVLTSGKAGRCGTTCWSSGFLPSVYQGVPFRSSGDPVLYLTNPPGLDSPLRRESLDTLRDLNRRTLESLGDPEIATRIEAFEMAYRMQTSVPELMDISSEPHYIHELYGTEPGKSSFANNCLLARRLIERGVRFVQIDHGGWDHHGGGDQNLMTGLPERCKQVDRGSAALIKDLKQRGLLKDTLVIWGGEFGRQPMAQGTVSKQDAGRDHLRAAFTIWMAGGGIRPGLVYGETDEFGLTAARDPVHVHDLQATILHLLGLDHTRLTYRYQGRDFRLTDVHGNVVTKLFAS
jgi:hypothetical protein